MNTFKRLFQEIKPFKKEFIILVLVLIGGVAIELSGPMITRYVLDELIVGTELTQRVVVQITLLTGLYFAITVLNGFVTYYLNYGFGKLSQDITRKIRHRAYEQLQKLPIDFFSNEPDGKIVAKITNDTNALRMFYQGVLKIGIHSLIYIVMIYLGLFYLNVKFALISLLILPFVSFWIGFFRKYAGKYNTRSRAINSSINAKINETIKGVEVIHAFNYEDEAEKEFEELNSKYLKYRNKMLRLNGLTSFNLMNTFRRLIYFLIIAYFGHRFLDGRLDVEIGVIYAFSDYLSRLMNPINNIFSNLEVLEHSRVSGSRVYSFLDEEREVDGHLEVSELKGKVEFQDVSFAYVDEEYVLKDINLKAEAGQSIALVGHTGSGKSSMMNVLLRFYETNKGKVLIDDMNIFELKKESYRKHVGIVLQDPVLFTGTIGSNISLNNDNITEEDIYAALDRIGAKDFVLKYTKKLDEPIIDGGANLSFGERQLVAFARAMLYDPSILVLDEATANIDTETEQLIQNALKSLAKDRTMFIIAHRLSTIKDVDKIIVLDRGRIIEEGTHQELISLDGTYKKMYDAQVMAS